MEGNEVSFEVKPSSSKVVEILLNGERFVRAIDLASVQRELEGLDKSLGEVMQERDEAQDALLETSMALGGPEWSSKTNLCLDVPELANTLQQQLSAAQASLRRHEGCPSCGEFHDEGTMCPPHEVRFKGFTPAEKLRRRCDQLQQEVEAAGNLLAVLHRDGGHHTAEVGFVQSCKDGEQVRHELVGEVERLKQCLKIVEEEKNQIILDHSSFGVGS